MRSTRKVRRIGCEATVSDTAGPHVVDRDHDRGMVIDGWQKFDQVLHIIVYPIKPPFFRMRGSAAVDLHRLGSPTATTSRPDQTFHGRYGAGAFLPEIGRLCARPIQKVYNLLEIEAEVWPSPFSFTRRLVSFG